MRSKIILCLVSFFLQLSFSFSSLTTWTNRAIFGANPWFVFAKEPQNMNATKKSQATQLASQATHHLSWDSKDSCLFFSGKADLFSFGGFKQQTSSLTHCFHPTFFTTSKTLQLFRSLSNAPAFKRGVTS